MTSDLLIHARWHGKQMTWHPAVLGGHPRPVTVVTMGRVFAQVLTPTPFSGPVKATARIEELRAC